MDPGHQAGDREWIGTSRCGTAAARALRRRFVTPRRIELRLEHGSPPLEVIDVKVAAAAAAPAGLRG